MSSVIMRSSSLPRIEKLAIINEPIPSSTSASYQLGDYIIGETIGAGTFGKVKIAFHRETKRPIAMKFLCRKKIREMKVAEKIMQEVFNHDDLHHPHIARLFLTLSCPTHIIMIMEYVAGGELFNYIVSKGKLSECESRRLFQQIISAVNYLHIHQIVHRDLKPENILLTIPDRNAKLADFGLSKYLRDGELLKTSCGSPNYVAPEIVSGKLYVGPEVDIWSCGVILYAMLTGKLPFTDETLPNLFKKIQAGVFEIMDVLSPDVLPLLKHLLTVDPQKRATAADLLKYVWFRIGLPVKLFAPVTNKISLAGIDGYIIKEASERLGIEEHEIVETVLHEQESGENGVRQEVEKIAAWISNDVKRNTSKYKRSVVDISKFPDAPKLRWHLGIRSINDPVNIMLKVYRSLKEIDFEWHIISLYHLIMRPKTGAKISIGLNLYQVNQPSSTRSYLLDFKLISYGSRDSSATPSIRSRSNSISSNQLFGRSRTSSVFNELFRERASSYDYQKKAKENAFKFVLQRGLSYSPEADKENQIAAPSSVFDMLQNFDLNGNSDVFLESSNEPENVNSDLLEFFEYCAQLIVKLMNDSD